MTAWLPPSALGSFPKRKVFVSFDHDDADQVNGFHGLRNFDLGFDFIKHTLDRQILGQSDEYKRRVIREQHIRFASVTVILIGVNYWLSKWSNWEIEDSVTEGNGLVAIGLKEVTEAVLPTEFKKYHSLSLAGFYPWQPENFKLWVEEAYQNRPLKEKYDAEVRRRAAATLFGRSTLLGGL